jgi:hypothetical protein
LLSKNLEIEINRNEMLPVVLYECETGALKLREECRLKLFENRELRGICGAKVGEGTGEGRKLHNEEVKDLYCSPNIFLVIKKR